MSEKAGILYLPSGPGLNSAPAREFLESLFSTVGPAIFWNEPSALRGATLSASSTDIWSQVDASLKAALEALPAKVLLVTESFGSILADYFFQRLKEEGKESRVIGCLHIAPVPDLGSAYSRIFEIALADFKESGNLEAFDPLSVMVSEWESGEKSLDHEVLPRALDLANTNVSFLPRYFRSEAVMSRWLSAFSEKGFAPDSTSRDLILKGMSLLGLRGETRFLADVPTTVCIGRHDPYRSLDVSQQIIQNVNAQLSRKNPVELLVFEDSSHYPYADEFEAWGERAFQPFLKKCLKS